MYWRAGYGFIMLWIAALTLALCAAAALLLAGSLWGALSFLAAAGVLCPPGQELIARIRHKLAPAKAALLSTITLVPVGVGFVIVDGVASLDREAVRLGFASAGHWARARDLKLVTPQALAAHDEVERKRTLAEHCKERSARPPLACFEAGHQKVAVALVEKLLAGDELEALTRDALARQRKTFLGLDKDCTDLLDRIDEDALPVIVGNRAALQNVAAGIWARHFAVAELEQMLARSKSGVSYVVTGEGKALEQKLAERGPVIERELAAVLQAWARRIVMEEPGWRSLARGRSAMTRCRPAEVAARP